MLGVVVVIVVVEALGGALRFASVVHVTGAMAEQSAAAAGSPARRDSSAYIPLPQTAGARTSSGDVVANEKHRAKAERTQMREETILLDLV